MGVSDRRLLALRTTASASITLSNEQVVTVGELLTAPDQAATHLSDACIKIFEGEKKYKSLARNLDVLAYGEQLNARASEIRKAMGVFRTT